MAELTTPLPRERALALNWSKLLSFAAFLMIVVLQVLGNLYWIARNVVPIGRDAGGHLMLALEYTQILDRLTLQSLFTALTYHDFRPPALYMATQVPYRLFGYSMDAAQMVNVALLIPILGLTFLLGRRLVGEHAGLLAVALTAFFPMMAAMTRLFYLENFHTTMVLAVLFCLLKSEGFASRRWAVLWGVSLGVGLLVKWALPTFVFLPILVAVWHSGIVRMQWESMRRPRVDLRALGVALFAAVLLASLWYFPNRARALALPLRDWLLVVWIVLLTVAFYALGRPSRPLTNCWAGLFVGLSVASLWYAARIDFVAPFIETAYGTYGGHFEAFDPRRLNNYVRYPRLFVTHHLGPLASLVLLPAGLLPWLARRRLGDPVAARLENAPMVAWLLWAGLLSAYLITAFSSQTGERNIVPVLPIVALLLAGGLARYPRRLALGFGLVWIGILALQWSIFTFDGMAPFHRATEPLWADGEFLVRPASGATDPAYWIAPDVLSEVQARHDPNTAADSTLG
ncbi:MAG TPA: glycosyltransferase family 39 protein, partial [Ardenticatenaceae bacterium]|nr:glycosyltransferase family 39 protein [Ardenticatenaceae bacterium]